MGPIRRLNNILLGCIVKKNNKHEMRKKDDKILSNIIADGSSEVSDISEKADDDYNGNTTSIEKQQNYEKIEYENEYEHTFGITKEMRNSFMCTLSPMMHVICETEEYEDEDIDSWRIDRSTMENDDDDDHDDDDDEHEEMKIDSDVCRLSCAEREELVRSILHSVKFANFRASEHFRTFYELECGKKIDPTSSTTRVGRKSAEELQTRGALGKSGLHFFSALDFEKNYSRVSDAGASTKQNSHDETHSKDENQVMHIVPTDHVRKPKIPKLKKLIQSKAFVKYAHRFTNAQYKHTLNHPKLNQDTEMIKTRPQGHSFVITADTQFGVLMDGFAMINPNWEQEIKYSRRAVRQINSLNPRPLFVCVCGDLVDTESSFSGAIASWKNIMSNWERSAIHQQQNINWKQVWANLHSDIALVCLCGNHDIGNRPTKESIEFFESAFGDSYLAFWANKTYNICLNNCLFFDNTGAPEIYEEQLQWLSERLQHANDHNATHIFVYTHFPWFLYDENEVDDDIPHASSPPSGWGPPGMQFKDSYFNIPLETRRVALDLFKKHNVTACFSGHFHQNLVAQTSWGMPMIVTGPLSFVLSSSSKDTADETLSVSSSSSDDDDEESENEQIKEIQESSDDDENNLPTQFCEPCNSSISTPPPPSQSIRSLRRKQKKYQLSNQFYRSYKKFLEPDVNGIRVVNVSGTSDGKFTHEFIPLVE